MKYIVYIYNTFKKQTMEKYIETRIEMEECKSFSKNKLKFYLYLYQFFHLFDNKKFNFYFTLILFTVIPMMILGFTVFNFVLSLTFHIILWFFHFSKQSNPDKRNVYVIKILKEIIDNK